MTIDTTTYDIATREPIETTEQVGTEHRLRAGRGVRHAGRRRPGRGRATPSSPTSATGSASGAHSATSGPVTSEQLAQHTGLAERYLREWLAAQASAGYVLYDAATACVHLPAEHAIVLADDDSPAAMAGSYETIAAIWSSVDKLAHGYATGEGVAWHEHDSRLFSGVERFFRPLYRNSLLTEWLPRGARPRRAAGAGHRGARRRLRPRHRHHPDGGGVPELDVRRRGLPRGVRAARDRGGRRGGGLRPADLRGAAHHVVRRQLRPDLLLRHRARPGRPGRRARARAVEGRGRRPGRRGGAVRPRRARRGRRTRSRCGGSPPATRSACRTPWPRAGLLSGRRPDRSGRSRCSTTRGSPTSGTSPRRRTTWSSRPAADLGADEPTASGAHAAPGAVVRQTCSRDATAAATRAMASSTGTPLSWWPSR